jgi:hypothetical protein
LTNVIFKWPDITLKLHHFSKLDLHAIKQTHQTRIQLNKYKIHSMTVKTHLKICLIRWNLVAQTVMKYT